MQIDWPQRAIADLKAIWEDIDQDRGPDTANRVAWEIHNAIQSLRTMPYRGRCGRADNTR